MAEHSALLLERREQRVEILINRERSMNSLDSVVLTELLEVFRSETERWNAGSREVSALILRGAGGKAFVAGADIAFMQIASKDELRGFIELGQELMLTIERCPIPVIAVIHGYALGGGLELALACDCIVATKRAKLGLPEVGLSLIPGFGGTQRLLARCGVGFAKRMILTGETIPAELAWERGIVDWLFAEEESESSLTSLVESLAKKGPMARAAAKRAISSAFELPRAQSLKQEVEEFLALADTFDMKEGLSAFTEKRTPQFLGR